MATFPFPPQIIGNLCRDCCPNCRALLGENAKCCKVGGTLKQCYDPKQCLKCEGEGINTKLIEYCKVGENLLKGRTSCCYGECFNPICDKCENKKVVPNYIIDKEGCCSGTSGGKFKLKTCRKCDENDNLISECIDTQTCCDGKCISDEDPCQECDGKITEDKPSGSLRTKCKDDNPENPNCCGGTCWNSDKDQCRYCSDDDGKLLLKDDCACCTAPNGNSKCCSKSKKEKCCSTGICVSSTCEECP